MFEGEETVPHFVFPTRHRSPSDERKRNRHRNAAKRLPKKARERVTVEMREKDYSWSPDLMIMTAKGE